VWSIILNLPLFIEPTPDPPGKPIFGFGLNNQNFERGNFSSRSSQIILTTEEKRIILRLRYFQLVSRGSIPDANAFLKKVFVNYGNVYLLDGLDMTITCVFTFAPSFRLLSIIKRYDIMPRPAGVRIRYVISTSKIFGFGINYQNFENGNFAGDLRYG
jgi:hypothetical protein